MRAQLKEIAPLGAGGLETFQPDNPALFMVWVTLSIGVEGTEAADDFRALICSVSSLSGLVAESVVLLGQPLIVAERWDFPLIKQRIEDYCSACEGDEWEDILPKLMRLGLWEFEDFNPNGIVIEH